MQTSAFRGSLTVTSFRLCSRAPWTISSSAAMSGQCIRGSLGEQVFCSTPRPLLGRGRETGLDGIREHVRDRVVKVVLVLDDRGREAVAEEVAAAAVPAVELLRIDAVHTLHAARERRELALDDEVQAGVHQAPSDDPPAALEHLPEKK